MSLETRTADLVKRETDRQADRETEKKKKRGKCP